MRKLKLLIPFVWGALILQSCRTTNQPNTENIIQELTTKPFENGIPVRIIVTGGQEYKYPIMAIWVEDLKGNFMGTLFASQSISTGIFRYGVYSGGKWLPGERNRPAALPRWKTQNATNAPGVRQGIDAFSGATPSGSFALYTLLPLGIAEVKVVMEVNKPWDFNNYWHNNRFPGDAEYATSGQPALIYETTINLNLPESRFDFKPVGHSNPSGANGQINPDITTFTSALKIVEKAWVEIAR